MIDLIEKYGKGSIIQHGKLSDRVYLMKLKKEDCPNILEYINTLAREENYSKLFCKVPAWAAPLFTANGFITEAQIPQFYNQKQSVFFMSKFRNSDRLLSIETKQLEKFSTLLDDMQNYNGKNPESNSKVKIRELKPEDAEQAVEIYKQVFESYPFPIHDPEYITDTMKDNIRYFGAEKDGKLIALSSAEIDNEGKNAEMTDFATLPEARGNNMAEILLFEMGKEMKKVGITTVYTIARLNSLAMNKTFLKQNYIFSGTLIKNTNIAGNIESMNVLYKHL